jgi:hypothetical protein
MVRMAIKATVVDEAGIHHLVIGLNHENVHSIVSSEIFTLPPGGVALTDASDIVILFAETDDEIVKRFPPALRPV